MINRNLNLKMILNKYIRSYTMFFRDLKFSIYFERSKTHQYEVVDEKVCINIHNIFGFDLID